LMPDKKPLDLEDGEYEDISNWDRGVWDNVCRT
jgi:hypothetical protein